SRHLPRPAARHVHRQRRGRGRGTPPGGWRDPRDQRPREVRVALRSGAQGLDDDAARRERPVDRIPAGRLGRDRRVRGRQDRASRSAAQRPPRGVRDVRGLAHRRRFAGMGALPPRLQHRVRGGVYQSQPPHLLYLGYISITIPFAFAMAALLSKRLDADWLIAIRKWTLLSWLFLSVGICLGMWWAYVELGWGGYWAWDPVENASLLPWLTMTAFLHSVMIQEKRGM